MLTKILNVLYLTQKQFELYFWYTEHDNVTNVGFVELFRFFLEFVKISVFSHNYEKLAKFW